MELQLVVDADDVLDEVRISWSFRLPELCFFVVQRLCVRVALGGKGSEGLDIDGESFLVVLHEFRQIEQDLEDLRRDVRRTQCRLQ